MECGISPTRFTSTRNSVSRLERFPSWEGKGPGLKGL